ncbi:MAG: thioredoxin-like domain-containing protein [Odoribacter splanchnicus]
MVRAVSLIHFIRSTDGQLAPFFLENGTIRMAIDSGNFLWARVSGTPNNNLRDLYTLESNFVRDSVTRATVADWSIYGRKDENYENEQFKRRSALIGRRWLDIQRDLVKRYPGQAFAPFLIMFEMVSDVSLDELKSLRAGLAPELSGHPYTLALDDYIANQSFGVGHRPMTLHCRQSMARKYPERLCREMAIADFWASWCGPCRREVPFLKELRKFGGKQLEVIGISVDRDGKKWRDAVRELGMKWTQCCASGRMEQHSCRRYNVQAVPYRADRLSGQVAAIDLQGKQL